MPMDDMIPARLAHFFSGKHDELISSAVQRDKEQRNAADARRVSERIKRDPWFRAMRGCRRRMSVVMRRISERRSLACWRLIGCSLVAFKAHIEKQFLPGMSWDNYGPKWHIDHITPCAVFDLRYEGQQKACFHYTNLQPLWAIDNLRKSYHAETVGSARFKRKPRS